MKNRMVDLRNHLFATLEALQDPDAPMDLERAKAIADVAQTVINSAKVEVDFLKVTEQRRGTGFIDAQPSSSGEIYQLPQRHERAR